MRSHQDIILFHKDRKFYGYITCGDFYKDNNRYDTYLRENELCAEILSFTPAIFNISPLGQRTRKAVEHLLFSIDAVLEDNVRSSIFRIIEQDYVKLTQLVSNLSEQTAEIYKRSYGSDNTEILDINKYKKVLNNNIDRILAELEGD